MRCDGGDAVSHFSNIEMSATRLADNLASCGGSMGPHDLATAPQQEAHSHAAGGGTLMPMSVQPRNARCQSFRRAKTWKTCQCFGPENAGPSFSSSTTSMVSSEASS